MRAVASPTRDTVLLGAIARVLIRRLPKKERRDALDEIGQALETFAGLSETPKIMRVSGPAPEATIQAVRLDAVACWIVIRDVIERPRVMPRSVRARPPR